MSETLDKICEELGICDEVFKLNKIQIKQFAEELDTITYSVFSEYTKYREQIEREAPDFCKAIDNYFLAAELIDKIKCGVKIKEMYSSEIKKLNIPFIIPQYEEDVGDFLSRLKHNIAQHEAFTLIGVRSYKNMEAKNGK